MERLCTLSLRSGGQKGSSGRGLPIGCPLIGANPTQIILLLDHIIQRYGCDIKNRVRWASFHVLGLTDEGESKPAVFGFVPSLCRLEQVIRGVFAWMNLVGTFLWDIARLRGYH